MSKAKHLFLIIARLLLLLIAVSIIAFVLVSQSPIDPLTAYIGPDSTLSPAAKAEITAYWGLDAPLPQRFLTWLSHLSQGDLGLSITYKRPVLEVIQERFASSVVLMLIAWAASGLLGFFIGIMAGLGQGRIFDKIVKAFCLALQSAPTFWLGLLLLSLFAVSLGWFPIGMAAPLGKLAAEVTLADRAYHLALPALTLTLVSISKITLYTRQKLIEIMNSDYIRFALARGENQRQLIRRHVLRNIALPAVTVQFAAFSELFGGMALAETVFSYPGIGTALMAGLLNSDVPLLLGIALFSALFVFSGNLLANLLYGVLDPRVKAGGDYV